MTALEVEGPVRRSVSVHFRISKDMYDSLEEEARRKNVSLNTLLNQVVSTHARDDLLFEEGGYVKMTKSTLRAALTLIPDDKLSEFGRLASKIGPDARMLARSQHISADTVLDELRLFSRSGFYSLNEERKNGADVISLIHDLGPRESVALAAYVNGLFALAKVHPRVTTTSSSVMIEY